MKCLIVKSKFEQAYNLIKDYSTDEKWEIISNGLYHIDPFQTYSFMMYLIAKETCEAEWEYYCFVYLVYCNPFFDDSMRLAAWHLKRALELDCNNIEYMKQVVSVFYSFSEQYFSDVEFLRMAKAIHLVEADNESACAIIKNLGSTD